MRILLLKKACLALLSAVTLGMLCSGQALAYKVGDFEVTPLVSASERYDSNINQVSTGEVDDFITNVSVGLNVLNEGKGQTISLQGSVDHDFFLHENEYDSTSEHFLGAYHLEIDKSQSLDVKESFLQSESVQTFDNQFGQTSGRYSYYLNRAGVDYTKELSKEWRLKGGYQNEIYSRDLVDSSDSVLHGLNLRSDYAISPETTLSGIYGFSVRQFSPGDDVYSNNLDVAARQYFTKQLFADLSAGAGFIDVQNGSSYTKPRAQFTLTDVVSEKTVSSFTILKRYDTTSDTSDVFDQWRASLDLNQNLSKRLNLHSQVFYGEGKYVQSGAEDKFTGLNLQFDYELTPTAKAFVSDRLSNTSSNREDREYTQNVIMSGVNYQF